MDQILVGQQQQGDGSLVIPRAGKGGESIVSELQPRYYENAYRGNLFYACNSAAVVFSTALTLTYVGICLSNPVGSGKNLVLLEVSFMILGVGGGAASWSLAGGWAASGGVTAHTTPLAVNSSILGKSAGAGLVDTACTLATGTPAYIRHLLSANLALVNSVSNIYPIEGWLVIPPGGYVFLSALTASWTAQAGFVWAEVPI